MKKKLKDYIEKIKKQEEKKLQKVLKDTVKCLGYFYNLNVNKRSRIRIKK